MWKNFIYFNVTKITLNHFLTSLDYEETHNWLKKLLNKLLIFFSVGARHSIDSNTMIDYRPSDIQLNLLTNSAATPGTPKGVPAAPSIGAGVVSAAPPLAPAPATPTEVVILPSNLTGATPMPSTSTGITGTKNNGSYGTSIGSMTSSSSTTGISGGAAHSGARSDLHHPHHRHHRPFPLQRPPAGVNSGGNSGGHNSNSGSPMSPGTFFTDNP